VKNKIIRLTAALVMIFIGALTVLSTQKSISDRLKKRYEFDKSEYRTPSNAIQLRSVRIFPGAKDEEAGIYIGHAQSMSADFDGLLYVPDDKNDEILVFSEEGRLVRRFGRTGQGPGEFLRPSGIFCGSDYILVREIQNRRFQFFSLAGKYQSGFHCFKDYYSFVVVGKSLVGVPLQSRPPEKPGDSALIEVMDFEGRVQRSFGATLDIPASNYTFDHLLHIALTTKNHIVAAFQFFPIVRLYSLEGQLIREFQTTSGIIEKIAPLNKEMIKLSRSGEQTPRGFTAHAIFVDADGIYVVIANKNRLEVLLYNENGDAKEYYYKNLETGMGMCRGLFVKKSPSGKRFFILRSLPYPGIEELIPYK
jgi:hypothetical protein